MICILEKKWSWLYNTVLTQITTLYIHIGKGIEVACEKVERRCSTSAEYWLFVFFYL